MEETYKKLLSGIQGFMHARGYKQAVITTSGDIDSTVVLKLAVDALGAENLTALIMPESGVTNQQLTHQAKAVCEFLGVTYHTISINNFMMDFGTLPWKSHPTAYLQTKMRLRANILYNYALTHHALVLGTFNKSERLLGYEERFGNLKGDIQVIGNLYKTEVVELAEFMELPPEIIKQDTGVERFEGGYQADELAGNYSEIDPILKQIELGEDELISKGMNAALVRYVFRSIEKNRGNITVDQVLQS